MTSSSLPRLLCAKDPVPTPPVASKADDIKAGPSRTFRTLRAGERVGNLYDVADQLALDHRQADACVLRRASRRADGSQVVLKAHRRNMPRSWRAVMSQLMAMPSHPQVLPVDEVVEDEAQLYAVSPLCPGSELWSLIEASGPRITENDCKSIMHQILLGLDHLHRNNIIHQDVKPDNIMVHQVSNSEGGRFAVRIIDFDLCDAWFPGRSKVQVFAGTPGFIAPEVMLGSSSPQSDLWAAGAVMYVLMTGFHPYPDFTGAVSDLQEQECGTAGSAGAKRLYNLMRFKPVDFRSPPWADFHLASDFCQKLLEFDPQRRPWSAQQVLRHRWLAFDTEDRVLPRCLV